MCNVCEFVIDFLDKVRDDERLPNFFVHDMHVGNVHAAHFVKSAIRWLANRFLRKCGLRMS